MSTSDRGGPARCPICGGALEVVLEVGALPVHVGVLWRDRGDALSCPKADIDLGYCADCGFVANAAFDPAVLDYEQEYDNALHHSGLFRFLEESLVSRLVDRYDLRHGTFLEVGCGNAHFLGLLAARAEGHGIGFDPSARPEELDPLAEGRVDLHVQEFDGTVALPAFDLVCVRQVLEHLPDPKALLATVGKASDETALLYADVPNGARMLRDGALWELVYEHFAYFTPRALGRLVQAAGFGVIELRDVFEGQFLGIEARYTGREIYKPADRREQRSLARVLEEFDRCVHTSIDRAQAGLSHLAERDCRAVVWGAGARTNTYLNLTGADDTIAAIVDVNDRKHGTFVGGSGHAVVAPSALVDIDPDVVIVSNPIYAAEIDAMLAELGLSPRLVTSLCEDLPTDRSLERSPVR